MERTRWHFFWDFLTASFWSLNYTKIKVFHWKLQSQYSLLYSFHLSLHNIDYHNNFTKHNFEFTVLSKVSLISSPPQMWLVPGQYRSVAVWGGILGTVPTVNCTQTFGTPVLTPEVPVHICQLPHHNATEKQVKLLALVQVTIKILATVPLLFCYVKYPDFCLNFTMFRCLIHERL